MNEAHSRHTGALPRPHPLDPKAIWIGVASGSAAILCCVSPVVLFLLGVSTASEAISLGNRLYYGYTWYFRGLGVGIAVVAAAIYLRRRRSCSVKGVRRYWRTLAGIALAMLGTYGALYAATSYLAVLGAHR